MKNTTTDCIRCVRNFAISASCAATVMVLVRFPLLPQMLQPKRFVGVCWKVDFGVFEAEDEFDGSSS